MLAFVFVVAVVLGHSMGGIKENDLEDALQGIVHIYLSTSHLRSLSAEPPKAEGHALARLHGNSNDSLRSSCQRSRSLDLTSADKFLESRGCKKLILLMRREQHAGAASKWKDVQRVMQHTDRKRYSTQTPGTKNLSLCGKRSW